MPDVVAQRSAKLRKKAEEMSREEIVEHTETLIEVLKQMNGPDEDGLSEAEYRKGAPIRWAAALAAALGLILAALILQLKSNAEGLTAAEMLSRFVFSFSVWGFFLLAFHLFDRLAVPEFDTYAEIRKSPVAVALYFLGHCVLFGLCVAFG